MIIIEDGSNGAYFGLTGVATIGRDMHSSIRIQNREVSGLHARVYQDENGDVRKLLYHK